nr:pyruvate, water dikinase regulatory protein [Pseudokordiimonas caeni]
MNDLTDMPTAPFREGENPGERIFHVHLVSDSTGETLEATVGAALVQFEGVRVQKHNWPLIRSAMQMERLMEDIREDPGLVMYTLVNPKIRQALEEGCQAANLPVLSILDPVINLLGTYFGVQASHSVGKQHMMDANYFRRIDALHYTMAHDDGQMTEELFEADIVLVGVSRSSKTPTSIYLANKGYKTANVPFVPNVPMPEELDHLKDTFVIGLTTSPDRLVAIRTNRLRSLHKDDDGCYTDEEHIKTEIAACRRYCSERGWPVLDVTRRSIEESAAAIIHKYHAWLEARREGSA